jgi:acyl dehydratase
MSDKTPDTDPEILEFFKPESVQIYKAEAPVSEWAIQAWCRAMGDANPVYRDREAAKRHGRGDLLAPPVMMHSFTFSGGDDENGLLNVFRRKLAAEYGINSVVAGGYEQEFLVPIRLGDLLTREVRFESISPPKITGVGVGHFVLMAEKITNQDGAVIGNQKMRILFFKPGAVERGERPAKKAETAAAPATPPVELPALEIPLTATLIVSGAIAANDFEKIHHDRDLAQRQGLKDIAMNILTSCGLALRYVTDWTGPAGIVKSHVSSFGVSNFPGDTMTFTATADRPFEPGRETQILLRGTNSLGTHINSTIIVS